MNSIVQKIRVFGYIDVQEFHLSTSTIRYLSYLFASEHPKLCKWSNSAHTIVAVILQNLRRDVSSTKKYNGMRGIILLPFLLEYADVDSASYRVPYRIILFLCFFVDLALLFD